MKREARIRRLFVFTVTSGRSIQLTMFFSIFLTLPIFMLWNQALSIPPSIERIDLSVGEVRNSVALGDLDGDGNLDLAVPTSDGVSVILGNGDGTFQTAVNYGDGIPRRLVAVGDLDGDGDLDLATACSVGDLRVSVLLGNGDGTFQTAVHSGVCDFPFSSIALGDLDGDGVLDLAAVYAYGPDNVYVLLGNGDGTFRAAVAYSVGDAPRSVAVGDLDGDGDLDLAVANFSSDGNVSLLLGHGDGTFEHSVDYAFGWAPSSVALGDLDGDGDLDMAVTNYDDDVSVRLGRGDGTFGVRTDYGVGDEPHSVALGDMDGDGDLDLVVSNRLSFSVTVRLGNGDGQFGSAANYDLGNMPSSIALGDLIGDGTLDLAVPLSGLDIVSVFTGDWSGPGDPCPDNDDDGYGDPASFNCPHSELDCDDTNFAVNPGRWEKLRNLLDDDCSMWTPDKTSPYYTSEYMISYPIAHAYLDGDSDLDLAVPVAEVIDYPPQIFGGIEIFLNKGGASGSYGGLSGPISALALGDLDSDGSEDMVAGAAVVSGDEDQALVFLGNGDGSFQEPGYSLDLKPLSLALGDLDEDGNLDQVVANNGEDHVSVLLGNGDGTFQSPVTYPAGDTPASVALGDLDGDGNLDMAVADYGPSGNAVVLLGNGDGTFQTAVSYPAGEAPGLVALGDLDGDGSLDMVLMDGTVMLPHDPMSISVLLGNGDGTFQPPIAHGFGEGEGTMALGDLDGDGVLDLAVSRSFTNSEASGHVSVLFGNGDGTFRVGANYAPGMYAMGVDLMDHDGDGDLDIALADNQIDLADPTDLYGVIIMLLNNGDGTFSASSQPAWGAASTVGMKEESVSHVSNYFFVLLVPVGVMLLWKRCRRRK